MPVGLDGSLTIFSFVLTRDDNSDEDPEEADDLCELLPTVFTWLAEPKQASFVKVGSGLNERCKRKQSPAPAGFEPTTFLS